MDLGCGLPSSERLTNNSYTKHDHTKRKQLCQTGIMVNTMPARTEASQRGQHATSNVLQFTAYDMIIFFCHFLLPFFFFYLKSCLHEKIQNTLHKRGNKNVTHTKVIHDVLDINPYMTC